MVLDFQTCFPHNWKAQGKQFTHREDMSQEVSIQPHPSFLILQARLLWTSDFHEQQNSQERDRYRTSWLLASLPGACQVSRQHPLRSGSSTGVPAVNSIWDIAARRSLRNSLQRPLLTGPLFLPQAFTSSLILCLRPTGPLLSEPLVPYPCSSSAPPLPPI